MSSDKRPRPEVIVVDDDSDEERRAPPPPMRPASGGAGGASGGASGASFDLRELKGDLFSVPSTTSLAHCVAQDMRLGKGIATVFRDRFGGLDELRNCGARVGEVYTLHRGERFIYNMVTKPRSSGTYPTLATMRAALESLRTRVRADGVTQLAMPRIGCGLDGLVWEEVRGIIRDVFRDSTVVISLYAL